MAKVFISYRRTDSAPSAGRIYDRLVTQFGRENVFKDVDDIPPGVRFGAYIQESLRQCSVMPVVIGRVWLNAEAVDGGRRLDDPKDWVRIEVEMAFSLGLTVIPLLVDGARMPKAAELPESLQDLAQIQSIEVRNDPDFGHSMGRVIVALDSVFASRSSPGDMGQPVAPSQALAPPPPAQAGPSIPEPVSGPIATSAAPASAAAPVAVEELPPVQEMPPAQVEQGRARLRRFWRPLIAILVVVLVVGSFGALFSKIFLSSGGGGNTPTVTEYYIPSGLYSDGITRGPDGALWFTEYGAGVDQIGRITTAGVVTEYPIPSSNDDVSHGITSGPDGALWLTEYDALSSPYVSKIDRITTAGVVTGYPLSSGSEPQGITSGPDGNLWFTEPVTGKIGRITTAGAVTEYPLSSSSSPEGITSGPDGNLWFTDQIDFVGQIGRITTAGVVTEYPTITSSSGPRGITRGPDGALWFTESYHEIGRITTG